MEVIVRFTEDHLMAASVGNHQFACDSRRPWGVLTPTPPHMTTLWAPSPCAGFFVKRYCEARELDFRAIEIRPHHEAYNPDDKWQKGFHIEIVLPPGFPEKHRASLTKVVKCSVKQTILGPPEFSVTISPTVTDVAAK